MGNELSRRHFFYGALLAGAVPAGGFGSVPSLLKVGYKSPNERLNLATIGAGGRAADDIHGCVNESDKGLTPNYVAFTDVDDVSAAAIFNQFPSSARYKDFRKMLDREEKNIDAVIIAIPDFMHATAAMWCMERGKHVYVEKPLTHTVWEARQLAAAAAKFGVATQMGNQGYSNNGARVASEIIWSGEIGDVTEVHAFTTRPIWPQGMTQIPPAGPIPLTLDWDLWLGISAWREYPGPVTTEAEGAPAPRPAAGGQAGRGGGRGLGGGSRNGFYQPFNWRGFFDWGCGPLGDMACHILGAVNMSLMLGAPKSVQVIQQDGKSPFAFPKHSITIFEFPARHNMAPVKVYWYDALGQYPKPYWPQGISEEEPIFGGPGAFGPAPQATAGRAGAANIAGGGRAPAVTAPGRGGGGRGISEGAIFAGSKGFLTTDTYGASVRLLPQERHNAYKVPPELLTRSPGHYADWMRACKGGAPACSNFSVSGPFSEWIVMGVTALHFDGKLEWDSEKMEFTNNAEANKYVKPLFRRGWSFT
ncbi:MAG TPA: Gfo/Idh/MocA family oxidoreductase [Bryobacteraceae bacterium]|nr:Gfo/Idh/MocA family oxidoreductase [Bryobacteraceae bacterium]